MKHGLSSSLYCLLNQQHHGPDAHGQNSGVINIIFNWLLSSLDAHGLVNWSATALDGCNIRALRCAAGEQKNIPISPKITDWVALAVVLAPKSIWRQTEAVFR